MGQTLNQWNEIVFSLFVGLCVGIMYELMITTSRNLKGKAGKVSSHILDCIFWVVALAFYGLMCAVFKCYEITWYMLILNVGGFFIERNSVGLLLAKTFKMLYNLIEHIKNKKNKTDNV